MKDPANMDGVTTFIQRVKGPMGIEYDQAVRTIPDGCSRCSATGTIEFVTEEDQEQWDNREPCDCCNEYCECDEYGPYASGVRNCEDCGGTGRVAGAGPLIISSMELAFQMKMERAKVQAILDLERDMIDRANKSMEEIRNRLGF